MPLHQNAIGLIHSNLEVLQRGERVKPIVIGTLTDVQLRVINHERAARTHPLPPVIAEVLFMGRHIYKSRIERDGYTIDDVLIQIESAMDSGSVVARSPEDGNGHHQSPSKD